MKYLLTINFFVPHSPQLHIRRIEYDTERPINTLERIEEIETMLTGQAAEDTLEKLMIVSVFKLEA